MEDNKITNETKKTLSLKDLASPQDEIKTITPKVTDTAELKPIDINQIAPPKPKFDVNETPVVKAYKELDDALDRKKKETEERLKMAKQEILEARIEKSIKDDNIDDDVDDLKTTKKDSKADKSLQEYIDENDELSSLIQETNTDTMEVSDNVKAAMNVANATTETLSTNTKEESTSKAELLKQQEELFNESDSEENFLEEEEQEDEDIVDEEDNSEEDLKEAEETQKLREEAFKEYQAKVKECISPMSTGKAIDLSKFKIRRKPVSYSKLLAERATNTTAKEKEHISSWILPNSGRTITLREFKGTDLDSLNSDDDSLNALQRLTRFYSTIYRHVVDPNKPTTLEAWLKSVSLLDVSHLHFAIYKASFEQSNYVTEICNNKKCLAMDLVKHPIMDMVKFKDEETKKKYMDIFNKKESSTPSTIEETPVQINDKYVFGIRFPSIYHSLFESTQISRNIAVKHQALLANMAFINSIYSIDSEAQELVPIDFKPDSSSFKNTVVNKFKIIVRVLKEFTPDEFAYLQRAIIKLSNDQFETPGDITYGYPESKCSKCGSVIPAIPQANPITMVFTRLQLTQESNY